MFRVALEQLLHDQGYDKGMLDFKIKQLESDLKNQNAKGWVQNLDVEVLNVVKKLGNQAVHPKTMAQLHALDETTIRGAQETFQYLLHEIYEKPLAEEELIKRLDAMKRKTY